MSSGRRYEIGQTVGRGAMGAVYRARLHGDGDFAKQVALKVLHRDQADADLARRLRDEARILGLIRHRAVVNVDALVWLDGDWAVVMEYVDGLDLRHLMERVGALPESCALEVASEVSGALHVAYHTEGPDGRRLKLLHRDIKPANIQVTTAGEVKVLDFGVARADFDAREAKTRSLAFGSLGYVAQERIDGVETPAGDIYSLGVVLAELMTGERFGQTSMSPRRHEARVADRCDALRERGVSEPTLALLRQMLSFVHTERPDAREVERRAQAARAGATGPPLRDWAENRLADAISAVRAEVERGELEGRTLEESPGVFSDAPPPAPRAGLGWMGVVALVGVLLLLGAVGLLLAGVGGMVAGSFLF
jgi:serine/threonine-protein kinase